MFRIRDGALLLVMGLALLGCGDQADSASAGDSDSSATATPSVEPEPRTVQISTSSWRPGDSGFAALFGGILGFTPDGCPYLGPLPWVDVLPADHKLWVVWPADFTSIVKPNGEQVIVTADGREIAEGDRIDAGGEAAGPMAEAGMPCIEPGVMLTVIESEVSICRQPLGDDRTCRWV